MRGGGSPCMWIKNSLMRILFISKKWISPGGGGSDNVDKVLLLNLGTFDAFWLCYYKYSSTSPISSYNNEKII